MSLEHDVGIRVAALDDATALADLSDQLGYPVSVPEMTDRLRILLRRGDCAVLVAHLADAVVGWAAVEQRLSLEGGARTELVGLVVDRDRRGAGVGGRLLTAAEQWATAHGAAQLRLRSNVIRARAHAFYEARGYLREKSQHVYCRTLQTEAR